MRTASPVAATALAALYTKDRSLMERSFNHLTGGALQDLDRRLLQEFNKLKTSDADLVSSEDDWSLVLAKACIRRIAHRCLGKYAQLYTSEMEDALKFHTLPSNLQQLATNMAAILNHHHHQLLGMRHWSS